MIPSEDLNEAKINLDRTRLAVVKAVRAMPLDCLPHQVRSLLEEEETAFEIFYRALSLFEEETNPTPKMEH